jgi:hypothetical protein
MDDARHHTVGYGGLRVSARMPGYGSVNRSCNRRGWGGREGALELNAEDLASPVEGGVHDLLGAVLTGALTFEGTPGRPPFFFIRR